MRDEGRRAGPVDVLVVDDEADLRSATVEYLHAFALTAVGVGSAEEARQLLRNAPVGLVLLDVNLPGATGFDLCREIRAHSSTPIIFVSARGGDDDQILGLSIGGDDYLTKPFSLALLLAKVRRMLDRAATGAAPTPARGYADSWLRVDEVSGRTWVDGREVVLKAMEDRLLRYLVTRQGEVVTKAEIFEHVWDEPLTSDGTLTVHIRRLRTKIEPDPDRPRYIRTVWGRGYLFEGRQDEAPR